VKLIGRFLLECNALIWFGLGGFKVGLGLDRILWLAGHRESFRPSGFTPAYGSAVRRFAVGFRRGAKAPLYLRSNGNGNGKGNCNCDGAGWDAG
jgi:hypothetical protein